MREWALLTVIALGLIAFAEPAAAQDSAAQIAVTAAGAVSIQPVDDAYVGAPYLDRGLGGLGPGLLAGLHVRSGRFVFNAEYTTAWIEVQQAGRTVPGGIFPLGGAGPGRLRDSMLSALVGAHVGGDDTTGDILAGVSQLLDTPSSNHVSLESTNGNVRRQVFTVGVDVLRKIAARTSIVVTARGYFGLDRNDAQQQVGIGRRVVRVGAGLRLALGS